MSASFSSTPQGAWNGCSPIRSRSSESCWMRGSWLTRGERVGGARRPLGGILPARPVHAVELLGLGVVRLHLVVGDRPCRRRAAVVLQLAEVLRPEPVEGRPVQLGRPAHEVVHLRLELLAVAVDPGVRRDVAAVHEHGLVRPVLRLACQPVAALEQQDALAGRGEAVRERAPAGAAADDDDVVGIHSYSSFSRSSTIMRPAASIRARCEKACGKLPRCPPVATSNSSA